MFNIIKLLYLILLVALMIGCSIQTAELKLKQPLVTNHLKVVANQEYNWDGLMFTVNNIYISPTTMDIEVEVQNPTKWDYQFNESDIRLLLGDLEQRNGNLNHIMKLKPNDNGKVHLFYGWEYRGPLKPSEVQTLSLKYSALTRKLDHFEDAGSAPDKEFKLDISKLTKVYYTDAEVSEGKWKKDIEKF